MMTPHSARRMGKSSASDSAARQRVRSSDHVRSQTMGKIVRRRGERTKGRPLLAREGWQHPGV